MWRLLNGKDQWQHVSHNERFPRTVFPAFPVTIVKAMDRPLQNEDETMRVCYVALWYDYGQKKEPVFGRARNNDGKIEAWFPHDGEEYHSSKASVGRFSLLRYDGPPIHNFRYVWIPITELGSGCEPVCVKEYSPVVVPNIKIGSFRGELLGNGNLSRQMAWVSYDGKEHCFTDNMFKESWVLCRMPF